MDSRTNPYSPGAGRIPVSLVGRDEQIDEWMTSLQRVEDGLDSRPMALYGLRGAGKTVLLMKLNELALDKDWITAFVEATRDKSLREQLSNAFESRLYDIAKPSAGQKVLNALKTALSFSTTISETPTFTFGIDLSKASGTNVSTGSFSSDLERFIRDLSDASSELDVGVAILIDEAQELSNDDMMALAGLAQAVAVRRMRVVIALTGLPTLPRLLAEAKSYAERLFSYQEIGNLNTSEALEALLKPAQSRSAEWTTAAAIRAVQVADGYPYFLQEYGSACWLQADESPIDVSDLRKAEGLASQKLDAGFFRSRWERATEAEKRYLQAMAEDEEGPSRTAELAIRLKTSQSSLSSLRSRLIQKGMIYAPETGMVAFTVPLFARFIKRQIVQ
jgi:type II secretory pathway predicted ATPase ExeA